MRKLVLLLAILALPGLALGQTLDVGIGGVPGVSIVNTGAPITLDVLITTPMQIDGAQYSLTAELLLGGVPQGPMSADGMVTYDPVAPFANGTVFAIGDYNSAIGVPAGAPMGAGLTMAAINGGMGPELYFNGVVGGGPAPQVLGLLAQYVVTVAPLGPGMSVQIRADVDPGFGNGYLTNGGAGGGAWHQSLPLTITPEPASILLLLGALPFLRRRR
jgi:hypothetical protein